ncbi:histidinol-phosphatase HisJ [Exiguobacterium sp. SH0S1]|uniref:histidinol-phosphatase HisJ n=1 Tax=Exiguobacterium sp. SH0S1 TaxID=2510949 RepID=UPI001038D6F6|nr:histidinol-phosphatase HisJ [Exiguobacterium sp. SH0S1]TCI80247.1 histidinol-phosphatase HisJ [Exiguobacterium sp. SH0S1]
MIDYTHDGHVHTPFCPHGSTDSLNAYVEQALAQGVRTLTFTEHAPLPARFIDPTPDQDSAMALDLLPRYIEEVGQLKRDYAERLEIRIGLEIDYLPGYVDETLALLEPYRSYLDETILSQHFLQVEGELLPVDFSPETFDALVSRIGSFEEVLHRYYEALETGLQFPWERLNVARIGHIDLPIKYQTNYSWDRANVKDAESRLLRTIASRGFGLDFNTAGLRKAACGQPYAMAVAAEATRLGIPLVLGSDAHIAADVGADFNIIKREFSHL